MPHGAEKRVDAFILTLPGRAVFDVVRVTHRFRSLKCVFIIFLKITNNWLAFRKKCVIVHLFNKALPSIGGEFFSEGTVHFF
jgi:hypothetical protein